MSHNFSGRYLAVSNSVSDSIGFVILIIEIKSTVSFILTPKPRPAFIWRFEVNLVPKIGNLFWSW